MTDQRDEGQVEKPKDGFGTDTDNEHETDRPSGWAGVDDALGGTGNRPAGPDYGSSSLDDETPGSQGEIEAGSEGDFGGPSSVEKEPADS